MKKTIKNICIYYYYNQCFLIIIYNTRQRSVVPTGIAV